MARALIGRRKQTGPNKSGKHMIGNSVEEGTHPAIVASRARFAIKWAHKMDPESVNRRRVFSEAIKDGLKRRAIIDGKESDMTVAQVIAEKRLTEAMGDAIHKDDVAIISTKLIIDCTEPKMPEAPSSGETVVDVGLVFQKLLGATPEKQ